MPRDDDEDEGLPSPVRQTTVEKDKPAFPVLEGPVRVDHGQLTIEGQLSSAAKATREGFLQRDLEASDAAAALVGASLGSSVQDSQPFLPPEDGPAPKSRFPR